jgi:hypothetical protein
MNVAFQLRQRPDAEPATALLLLRRDAAALFALCARLGADPLPTVHDTADGLLLVLDRPTTAAVPHALRLRALCPHLLVPVDADLSPQLHGDELRGLVRDRGLVLLPGGRVLAFAPAAPLPLAALVELPVMRQTAWQPLPEAPRAAERIVSIRLELPLPPPEALLDAGAGDIGSEEPRPSAGGMLDSIAANVQSRVGRSLMGLGGLPGLGFLARWGARMVGRAMERVPRLSESLLGKQEAALRELLRLFRAGKLDDALKRALPLGGPAERGGSAAGDARLPLHNLFYSLANILGPGGPPSVWYGGFDVQRELAMQYRKAAEEAANRGDHRRAAFIYGKLLGDYRAAADCLARGGLHADAAHLYLHKLHDLPAAAREFERAGDIDQSVRLWRQVGDHAAAGDVLRRAGDEETAFAEYTIAADRLAERGSFLEAAELMQARAQRPDRAETYLQLGWGVRPLGNSLACGNRLARLHADRRAGDALLSLTREARAFYDSPGHQAPARDFYHLAAGLADEPALASVRGEVRDLALLGLATKVREAVAAENRAGDVVSRLLGAGGAFAAPVVSDARFAVNALVRQPDRERRPRAWNIVNLGMGHVTATCAAAATGEVFVGFDTGQVVCFRPSASTVVTLTAGANLPVIGMTCDATGAVVVVQSIVRDTPRGSDGPSDEAWTTVYHSRNAGWESAPGRALYVLGRGVCRDDVDWLWCGWDEYEDLFLIRPGTAAHWVKLDSFLRGRVPASVALLQDEGVICAVFAAGSLWYHRIRFYSPILATFFETHLGWTPQSPVSWLRGDDLELAALGAEGAVHWSRLKFGDVGLKATATLSAADGYKAATLVRPGLVAAVGGGCIDWLRAGRNFQQTNRTVLDLGRVVACHASLPTSELLMVTADGRLHRVPLPA